MKKYARIIAVLSLILILLCGCTGSKATNEGYALYRSSPVGVEIEYPDFWEMADDKEARTVAFAAPNEGFADEYRENVTIQSVEVGTEDMAFDSYVKNYITQLPSSINEYNLVSENETTVSGNDAYTVVYEGKTEERSLRLSQTFIESGKYVFIYTYIAEPASYDYYNMNSQVMLATLKLLRK